MKKMLISAALAVMLIGSSVGTTFAYGMNGGGQQGFHGKIEHRYPKRGFINRYMVKELNLTPEQIQQIKELRKEEFRNFAQNRSNFKMPMYDAIKSGNFNKQVFINESVGNAQLRAENRANYMEHFFNILTPQQRQKFVALQQRRMQFALKNMENRQKMLQERINYLKSNVQ